MEKLHTEKLSIIQEFIEVMEMLKKEGIAVEEFRQVRHIENENPIVIRLADVADPKLLKKYNLDGSQVLKTVKSKYKPPTLGDEVSHEVIEKLGLKASYPIGLRIALIISMFNGTKESNLTEDQEKRLEKLGLVNKNRIVGNLINVLETLKNAKVQIEGLQPYKKENGEKVLIEMLDIASEELLKQCNLDIEYKIGYNLLLSREAYRGRNKIPITNQEKKKLEKLGIVGNLAKKDEEQRKLKAKQKEALELYNSALFSWVQDKSEESSNRDK